MTAPVNKTPSAKKKSTFKCPDCGSACRVTNSKIFGNTYKEFNASCTSDKCGGRYVFGSEPVRILTPSQTPNPMIDLPMHDHSGQNQNPKEV